MLYCSPQSFFAIVLNGRLSLFGSCVMLDSQDMFSCSCFMALLVYSAGNNLFLFILCVLGDLLLDCAFIDMSSVHALSYLVVLRGRASFSCIFMF